MTTWLQKQRKQDLTVLADEAGLRGAYAMRKEELIDALDKHLTNNSSTLSSKPSFQGYFVKGEPGASSETASKPRKRVTKAPVDFDDAADAAASLVTRTPRAVQRAAAQIPLPASPAAVTNLVERETARFTTLVEHYVDASGVAEYAGSARDALSTVVAIQTIFLAFEAYGLQRAVLPWRYAFTVPGLKVTSPLSVSAPDMFVFLTSNFWGPTTLWLFTSLLAPAAIGWLVNLTVHASKRNARYTVDPLIFSITKAVLSWLVYAQGWGLGGLVDSTTVLRVEVAVPGGWFGIVIGSLIGVVASVYEVVLRK